MVRFFVRFNQAVVIDLGNATALSAQALEGAVVDEMQARFIVGSVVQRLGWQTEGSVHYLKQALLDQGGAYAISGKSLIIASNKEYCAAVVAASVATTGYTASLSGKMQRFAVVRPSAIKPVFGKLTKVLDANQLAAKNGASADSPDSEGGEGAQEAADGDDSGPVTFFGGNIKSLIDVTDGMGEATFESSIVGDLMMEVIVYHLS